LRVSVHPGEINVNIDIYNDLTNIVNKKR